MFDFIKDVVDEARGVDVEQRDRLHKAQKSAEKNQRVFLPKDIKSMIYFFGVLYVILAILVVIVNLKSHAGLLGCVKQVLCSIISIASLVLISIEKKQTEIIGLILFSLFAVLFVAL